MKSLLLVPFSFLFMSFSFAPDWHWKSAYTDIQNDCIVISEASDQAPIDFYEAECRSYGGYQLYIEGGDLRYGPKLVYNGARIDLKRPGNFHDPGSDKIEWVYRHTLDAEGSGSIEWTGLIYRLSVVDSENGTDSSVLYAVRLDGEKSCVVGTSATEEEAHSLIYHSRADCK